MILTEGSRYFVNSIFIAVPASCGRAAAKSPCGSYLRIERVTMADQMVHFWLPVVTAGG
jgi:hypothetical protein